MNEYIKNIILSGLVFLSFAFAITGTGRTCYNNTHIVSATKLFFIESQTNTENPKLPEQWVSTKPRVSVLKIEIQTLGIVPPSHFPSIHKFVVIRSFSPYRLSPQNSYVRYLPRDPPKA